MNLSSFRKISLWSFIGFLSITALLAVFSLVGNTFGETQWKVLASTFSVSAASICAMSCAAFIEKKRQNFIGITGIISAGIAAALAIFGIWTEPGSEYFWKTMAILIVVSVAFAHALLLLIPTLTTNHKWTQKVAVVLISILTLQIIYAICTEGHSDDLFRFIAISSVFVVLMTFVIPICAKLQTNPPEAFDRLVLRKLSEDIYTDQSGRKLRVTVVEHE